MKIKSTKTLKYVVFAFAVLLCLALSLAATGAFLKSFNNASGTIHMDQGIIIGYTGFEHEEQDTDSVWQKNEVNFKIFNDMQAIPLMEIPVSPATICAAEGSVDFNARFKLEYQFFADAEGNKPIASINTDKVLVSSLNFIGSDWVESVDGYYYYATGTTLNTLSPNGNTVNIFADDAKFKMKEGEENLGFGFEVDDVLIKRIEVVLTLETKQAPVDWEIELPPYFNSDWKNLLTTDADGNPTGITVDNVKTIAFLDEMPEGEGFDANNFIPVGALTRDSTDVDDNVVAYYYKDENDLYHIAIVSPDGETIRAPTSCYKLFEGFTALTSIDFTNFSTKGVTNMANMFRNSTVLEDVGNLSGWDTSNVTDMSRMFTNCNALTSVGDVSDWDVSNVTNMQYMFYQCETLSSLDVGDWDVSKVTSMYTMFYNCLNLTTFGDLSGWDVGKVTNMAFLFSNCTNLQNIEGISGWNVTSLQNAERIFQENPSLTKLDLSGWELTNVTTTTGIFYNCTSLVEIKAPASIRSGMVLNLPTGPKYYVEDNRNNYITQIGNSTSPATLGKTIKVGVAITYNPGAGSVGATKAIILYDEKAILPNATREGYTLTGWYTGKTSGSKVGDAGSLYSPTSTITLYARWEGNKYEISFDSQSGMGGQTESITATYSSTMPTISTTAPTKLGCKFDGWYDASGTQYYTATGASARNWDKLENATLYAHYVAKEAYFNSNWKNLIIAAGIGIESIKTIEFATAMPTDESYNENNYILVGSTSKDGETVNDSVVAYYYQDSDNLYHIAIVSPTGGEIEAPNSCLSLFEGFTALTTVDLTNFDTTGVTNMENMFRSCFALTSVGDLSGWDMSSVTNMKKMFSGCNNLTGIGDLSGWDVSNVTDMTSLFYECAALTDEDLSGVSEWDVGNVKIMNGTFRSLSITELDLSGWNVSNVEDMYTMIYNCQNLKTVGNLSGWNVSKVKNLGFMFSDCFALEAIEGISGWDVTSVENADYIFQECENLTELDLSGWELTKVTTNKGIFYGAINLVEIKAPASIASGKFLTLPTAPTGKKWVVKDGGGTAITQITAYNGTLNATLILVDV